MIPFGVKKDNTGSYSGLGFTWDALGFKTPRQQ